MPQVTVTRVLRFSAAHRVHNPTLDEEENLRLYGKCNNPSFHGHNYRLEVSVAGEIDTRSGYVMDLAILRDLVTKEFVDYVDHKNLNLDVPFMEGVNPTTEHFIVACWRVLEPRIAPAKLVKLKLWETENNYVEFEGR